MSQRLLEARRAAGVRRVGWTGPQRAAMQRTVTLQKLDVRLLKISNRKLLLWPLKRRATKTEDVL